MTKLNYFRGFGRAKPNLASVAFAALVGCTAPIQFERSPRPSTTADLACIGINQTPARKRCEVGTVPMSDAGGVASAREAAERALLAHLCSSNCPTICDLIRQGMETSWKSGKNHGLLCAIACVDEDLAKLGDQARSVDHLPTALKEAAADLMQQASGALAGRRPLVQLEPIDNNGVVGGELASWLYPSVLRALGDHATCFDTCPVGLAIDLQIQPILRGPIRRHGLPMLEMTLAARWVSSGGLITSTPVFVPQCAVPAIGQAIHGFPQIAAGLRVRVQAPTVAGGGVCAGTRGHLLLSVPSRKFVRLFDLFGADRALLVYPSAQADGEVFPGGEIDLLAGHEFTADPYPGTDAERFVAFAADTLEELGIYAAWHGQCRVSDAAARDLHAGRGVPSGAVVGVAGFRIVQGPACPATGASAANTFELLGRVPLCSGR